MKHFKWMEKYQMSELGNKGNKEILYMENYYVMVVVRCKAEGSLTINEQRAVWCHMCLIKTHATILLVFVKYRIGNSFGSLSVLCQANTDSKN